MKVILGFETSTIKNLEQQFSEDLLMIQSSKSVREYSDPIPVDLLIDIFSRVPAKSIARFRCVSKFWESILRRPDFTELFLTKSSTHPRLFFTVKVNEELLVFSSPQPQNPNKNSSLVATRYKSFPKSFPTQVYTLVNGLVFLQDWDRKAQVICNPATGESITLPKVKATGIGSSYLGFDPISKQFKVLCMILLGYERPNTHRVLTLETGKCLWRTIQDPLPHHSRFNSEICINGVLYYAAYIEGSDKIVCFDFRFEKFSLINMDRYMVRDHCQLTLLNNKGKLCACYRNGEKLVLWVLEDAGKHKWSKSKCVLLKIYNMYKIVGMTGTGEIVFTSHWLLNPFYIFYYHIEGKTLTRVNIKGFEEFECHPIIFSFLDYVESIKFM